MDRNCKAYKYTIGIYGNEESVNYYRTGQQYFDGERIETTGGVTVYYKNPKPANFEVLPLRDFCIKFYRERTGEGETRNPNTLVNKELVNYTQPIKKKKNESVTDYRLRQLDYWDKNTYHSNALHWGRQNEPTNVV